jgi:hypothetical protein
MGRVRSGHVKPDRLPSLADAAAAAAAVIMMEDQLAHGCVLFNGGAHQRRLALEVACNDSDTPAGQ